MSSCSVSSKEIGSTGMSWGDKVRRNVFMVQ
jgi:hypothetical protein